MLDVPKSNLVEETRSHYEYFYQELIKIDTLRKQIDIIEASRTVEHIRPPLM